jgi:hypothetical protein
MSSLYNNPSVLHSDLIFSSTICSQKPSLWGIPQHFMEQWFITVFTTARHWSLSWASRIWSTPPNSNYLRSISILSSSLRLGLASGLFPSGFPTKNMYTIIFHPQRATCHVHLIHLDLIILIILGEEYKLWISSLCSFVQPPVTSSLFGPNILLKTLFSNTTSLYSSLNVREQYSHPNKTH